jgi:hypothetical protein
VIDEFEKAWGFPFVMADRKNPWSEDMAMIFEALHVVDNNGPQRIGGGGTPRQPLAVPLTEPPAAVVE